MFVVKRIDELLDPCKINSEFYSLMSHVFRFILYICRNLSQHLRRKITQSGNHQCPNSYLMTLLIIHLVTLIADLNLFIPL